MNELRVSTGARTEMINITGSVSECLKTSGIRDGLCTVFVPHTTAAVTINEDADPDVCHDIIEQLNKKFPHRDGYRHGEGNSDAHIKTSLVGSSETVIVRDGRLQLGTWQSIFFCEFDGPRTRKVWVSFVGT